MTPNHEGSFSNTLICLLLLWLVKSSEKKKKIEKKETVLWFGKMQR
jgi:hypothetical protein